MPTITRRSLVQWGMLSFASGMAARALPVLAAGSGSGSGDFRIGVNLAGAEFKTIGGRWKWPKQANLEYYLAKGFNVFRVPFKWHRLQPVLGGPLDTAALVGLDAVVKTATAHGAVVLLDSHDYGRRDGQVIGLAGSSADAAAFGNFWGRLAQHYKGNRLVWYNLMNEPHDEDPMANLAAQNAACAAIRKAGARSKVLFSGVAWTGAHSWVKSGNAKVMLAAHDPGNNFAFDAHQYLDKGFGGSSPDAIPGVGAHILNDIYAWGRAHGRKIFLGEFGTGTNPAALAELDALLSFMAARQDVFLGGTYFAGGGTWGRKQGSSDPVDGVEKPQTLLMQRYLKR